MHIIPGRLTLGDMTDGVVRETKTRDVDAEFTVDGEGD